MYMSRRLGTQVCSLLVRITTIWDCFDLRDPHVHMSHVDSAFMCGRILHVTRVQAHRLQFPRRDHYHLRLLWFDFPHVHTSHVVSVMYGGFPMSPGSRDIGLQFACRDHYHSRLLQCLHPACPHVACWFSFHVSRTSHVNRVQAHRLAVSLQGSLSFAIALIWVSACPHVTCWFSVHVRRFPHVTRNQGHRFAVCCRDHYHSRLLQCSHSACPHVACWFSFHVSRTSHVNRVQAHRLAVSLQGSLSFAIALIWVSACPHVTCWFSVHVRRSPHVTRNQGHRFAVLSFAIASMLAFRMFTCHMSTQLSCKSEFPCQQGPGKQACSLLAGITMICNCFDLRFRMSTSHSGKDAEPQPRPQDTRKKGPWRAGTQPCGSNTMTFKGRQTQHKSTRAWSFS